MAEGQGQPGIQDPTGEDLTDVKVAICIPTHEVIPSLFAYSLGLAMGYMGKNHPYVNCSLQMNNGTVLTEMRTMLAKTALLDKADWLVWFDSDMRFPMDTIERLLAHKQSIVGCNYSTRKIPDIKPTAFNSDDGVVRVYTEEHSTGLESVSSLGFGCIAIHKEVFEAIPPPWFHIPWNEKTMKYECGEDVYFCRRAREAGFEVMLDHDLSKEIAHIGVMEFDYTSMLAAKGMVPDIPHRIITK
jgi:hypothetical protein